MAMIILMPAGVFNEDLNKDIWRALYSLTPDRTISVLKKQGLFNRDLTARENNQMVK